MQINQKVRRTAHPFSNILEKSRVLRGLEIEGAVTRYCGVERPGGFSVLEMCDLWQVPFAAWGLSLFICRVKTQDEAIPKGLSRSFILTLSQNVTTS